MSGRVRHMGFAKTPSVVRGLVRVQTLVVRPPTVQVQDPMFRQLATLMLKQMERQAGTLSPELQEMGKMLQGSMVGPSNFAHDSSGSGSSEASKRKRTTPGSPIIKEEDNN
ncbi:hypothetical protein LINGRAPRIM_LOCUS2470 [Linum grandiflorum]